MTQGHLQESVNRIFPNVHMLGIRVKCKITVMKPVKVAEGEEALKVPDLCPICLKRIKGKKYVYAITGERELA